MAMAPEGLERVAHRGASRERLENTMAAFKLALERGADAIELDVHATADGVVVVHHDPNVGGRAIAATNWADITAIPLKDDARIPRLEDVMKTVADRAQLYIELKGAGCEAAALGVARRFGQRFAVHSFDHGMIERAARLAPDVPRGVLIDRGTPTPVLHLSEAVRRTRPRDVWPHYTLVDAHFMEAASALGVRVVTWTVNSAADGQRFAGLGVSGICTDDVRLLANL